jgi:mxaK protein
MAVGVSTRVRGWGVGIGVAALVLGTLAALDLHRLRTIAHWNEQIKAIERSATPSVVAAPSVVTALGADAPAEARFAAAWVGAQDGELTRAVALYRDVAQARPDLAGAALYDAANALMREGGRIAGTGDWVGARPLFELAKETYREALRQDSGRWDARYNLERALRLAPEEEDVPSEPLPMGGERERSVTTMRAFTLGLP